MKTVQDVLTELQAAKAKWVDAESVDDAEDMWIEYPRFLRQAVPILEAHLLEHEKLKTADENHRWQESDGSYR